MGSSIHPSWSYIIHRVLDGEIGKFVRVQWGPWMMYSSKNNMTMENRCSIVMLVFGGVNRFPPSFCGICSEGLLTMKWFIKKFIDFPWFSLFVVYFHQGKLADIRPGNSPEESQTQPNPPGNPRNFGGSKFQSSNPIKSYPPTGFPDSICKPSQITSGHTWILRGLDRIAKVNDKELAEKCPGINVILGPGMKTRVDAWVFFPKHGGKRLVFFYIIL